MPDFPLEPDGAPSTAELVRQLREELGEEPEHGMTVGELRAALADLPDDDWVVVLDPTLLSRRWLDRVTPGRAELLLVVR
jgi:hypothetical protein